MAASIVIVLYLWAFFLGVQHISSALLVSTTVAGLAALTIIAALTSYFFASKKYMTHTALGAYILLAVTIAFLLLETGGAASPFIALWMFVSVFAGIFGAQALIPLAVAVNLYLLVEFTKASLSRELIVGIILAGELPLIMSFLLWHSKSKGENNKERAYFDLANELNQVSNKSEVVINAIGEGVIAVNNQGSIELINPAAQRIIGWGRQDAVGLDYKSVLHLIDKTGHDLTKANDPIFDVITTNQSKRRTDLQLVTNSGKKLNVSVVASPIGRLGSGAIIVFHDITKELAEEREQAEFISTASHEMRTPVASIEGYLGLALNPATATIDEKARDFISKAHESAQHLGRLFQDLLDVTKAEDGRLSNNPKVVDVVAYTQTIIEGLKPRADAKSLRIFFKPETTSSSLTGGAHSITPVFYAHLDVDHLREVLANLIENAIKYTPKGEVVIDIIGDNEHILVSITDSGIGIPAEDIPHLFQKFYRVDNSDTREIGGTGLGLYLCRRLAEAMNGRIWVESEYKKGSTFYVELPRISHEEATKLIEQSEADTAASEAGKEQRDMVSGGSTFNKTAGEQATFEIDHPKIILSHGHNVIPGSGAAPNAPTATPSLATIEQNPAAFRPTASPVASQGTPPLTPQPSPSPQTPAVQAPTAVAPAPPQPSVPPPPTPAAPAPVTTLKPIPPAAQMPPVPVLTPRSVEVPKR